jgi:hypothetical protein
MTLKEKYAELSFSVNTAQSIRIDAEKKARDQYYETTRETTKELETMLNSLKQKAFDIALDEDAPPYDRSGGRVWPDKFWLTDKGVDMRWDADHPNDIRDYLVSYEKLEQRKEEGK